MPEAEARFRPSERISDISSKMGIKLNKQTYDSRDAMPCLQFQVA